MKKILFVVAYTFLCLITLQSCYVMDPYQGFYGQPNMFMSPQVPNFGGNFNPYLNAVQPIPMVQNGWNAGWGMNSMPWYGALLGGASFGMMPQMPYQMGFHQGYPMMYQNRGYRRPPQQRYYQYNQGRRCR